MRVRNAATTSIGVFSTAFVAAALLLSTPASGSFMAPAKFHTIHVTQADSGKQYVIHVGDHLDVRLAGPSTYTWSEPSSSRSVVLRRTKGASGSVATGTFVASAKGSSKVSATDYPNCFIVCLPPSVLFKIEVRVVK